MNGRERYLAVLRREQVDVVPRIPILMRYAAEYIGSNYGAFASDYRVLVQANRQCAADFDFDQVSAISDPYRETQGFGGQVTVIPDGVPLCTPPLAETKDLSVLLKPDPYQSERMADRLKALEEYRRACGQAYSILGWIEGPAAEAADLRGVTPFIFDLMDDPGFVGELMDVCVEVGIAFARAQVEAGADTIGIGDAICSQLSPGIYEQLIYPREKRLVESIQQMGAYVRLHICGNITHLLPGLAQLKVDILDVDHMVDMAKVRDTVGPEVVISGNLDPVGAVLYGTPESIREQVRRSYQAVGNPYMVNAGCEIPAGTPVDNLKALCEPVPYQG